MCLEGKRAWHVSSPVVFPKGLFVVSCVFTENPCSGLPLSPTAQYSWFWCNISFQTYSRCREPIVLEPFPTCVSSCLVFPGVPQAAEEPSWDANSREVPPGRVAGGEGRASASVGQARSPPEAGDEPDHNTRTASTPHVPRSIPSSPSLVCKSTAPSPLSPNPLQCEHRSEDRGNGSQALSRCL